MDATLTGLLEPRAVPFETLHQRYGALLELVRRLIGVVPNCDPYLEIWPPGLRTYNVMVPNFLNLPFSLWGIGAPTDVVGLGMYVSSRTAGCAYCSAHTCSFALRRGAEPETLARALDGRHGSDAERAVIAVARTLSEIPCRLGDSERQELSRHFSSAHAESIVLGISMMGFLNKFMDAVGVELEASTIEEVNAVMARSGWVPGKHLRGAQPADGPPPRADTLGTKLSIVRYIPSALSLDGRWTKGVPKRWPAVGAYLRERTGHDFPVLSRLGQARAIRAIAVMVRDNLDASTTVLGLPLKIRAGQVFAEVVQNQALAAELAELAAHHGSPTGDDQPLLALARAASPSPAQIGEQVIAECAALEPAAIVELVVWLSVLQMLHRVGSYYP